MLPPIFCLVDERAQVDLLPGIARAGVTGFQVRSKRLGGRGLVRLTVAVQDAVRPHGGVVVVNDRLDVALAADADGVHLGADDIAVPDARRMAPGLLIGATCRDRAGVVAAKDAGADYAGFGPVFRSSSKAGLPAPVGVAALRAATGVLPLIGISGIDARTVGEVLAAGAHGVAVIGAIWATADPVAAARALVAAA